MFYQISAIRCADSAPTRWSRAFIRQWRVKVLGLSADTPAYESPGLPDDATMWVQQKREWRVASMIPSRQRSDGSAWGHARIGWGPSPSGQSIRRAMAINCRDALPDVDHGRRKKNPRKATSPEQAAAWRTSQAKAHDHDGNVAADNGLATFEAPSPAHPRGRAFIVAIARQYPNRWKGVWRKLNFKQRQITLAYFGEIGGTQQDVADRNGKSRASVCTMLARVNKLVADAGLPELMQCRDVSTPTVNYIEHQIESGE